MARGLALLAMAAAGMAAAGMAAAGVANAARAQPAAQCPEQAGPLVAFASPDGRMRGVVAPRRGGALVSLALDGKELLYRGLDFCGRPGWDGKAPVLWPATGRNFALDPGQMPQGAPEAAFGWIWHGKRLAMPIHGFARDKQWHLDGRTRSTVRVSLADDAQTRTVYPFGFHLRIAYRLSGHRLTVSHRVTASRRNAEPMPFSIGNHITIALAGDGPALLSSPASLWMPTDGLGRPDGMARPHAPLVGVALSSLGRNAALSLGGYRPGAVSASLAMADGSRITIGQSGPSAPLRDAVRFTLWGDAQAGYFAIEPWYGRQNALASGEGIVHLRPGRSFTWAFTVAAGKSRD